MTSTSLAALARRLDALALDQLRAECARLAAENETLRDHLVLAEERADFWCREAMHLQQELCQQRHAHPGITPTGHLVLVGEP